MKIVNTNDVLLRNKRRWRVVIADDNIFVICRMNYNKKEGCDVTSYAHPEVYANQSDMNTLEDLHFSIIKAYEQNDKSASTKYRKKSVVVEAVQINKINSSDIYKWSKGAVFISPVLEPDKDNENGVYWQIKTIDSIAIALENDWIIKGVSGEFYPCKPDIFEKTYEEVV
jgi:hypothetical protein